MIGLGLSLDSFAVSVSIGLLKPQIHFRKACKVAAPLALFQAAFPVIGWYIGNVIGDIVASIDHWIAFGLLALIGGNMIKEGLKTHSSISNVNPFKISILIGLSIATSIDAFVVGITFGFLETPVYLLSVVVGPVTFIASMLGLLFGKFISVKRSQQSLIIGGIILILLGIKILIEHLWF